MQDEAAPIEEMVEGERKRDLEFQLLILCYFMNFNF